MKIDKEIIGKKTIMVPTDGMINLSNHEDDDFFIAKEPLEAIIIDDTDASSIQVIIPKIDRNRIFYIHKPEKKV